MAELADENKSLHESVNSFTMELSQLTKREQQHEGDHPGYPGKKHERKPNVFQDPGLCKTRSGDGGKGSSPPTPREPNKQRGIAWNCHLSTLFPLFTVIYLPT